MTNIARKQETGEAALRVNNESVGEMKTEYQTCKKAQEEEKVSFRQILSKKCHKKRPKM